MSEEHPNVSLLKRLNLGDLAGSADLFAEDFVWHFFNPRLPDVQGDYAGLAGLQAFFEKLGAATGGTFAVEPISIAPFGDELVVTCVRIPWPCEACRSRSTRSSYGVSLAADLPKPGTSQRSIPRARRHPDAVIAIGESVKRLPSPNGQALPRRASATGREPLLGPDEVRPKKAANLEVLREASRD